ncbi:hypothetical protein [Streptomyces stelliscabiei]|uniref:8-oxo-dGTP diphosphatase n=1 Tax=Streptomyces stelliscabiei TaxID=146820 RepID=A0A8I0TS33_9ACTN|nr:hypothetical protein [Streptomyces stelliscabiei]MBE1598309.1 8-oxo-dGTP diphosphatase [Streptomyces stelliscabiei]MDX3628114.1 hypothetical protein [Streptomyces stelliscabiei]
MTENSDTVIRAAGCVLWRRSPEAGDPRICLVHRPKYDESRHRSSR